MIPKALSLFFGALWTVGAAWALGRTLIRFLRLDLSEDSREWVAFVAGSAALSTLLFALGAFRLLFDVTFWALGFGALLLAWRYTRGWALGTLPAASRWFWLVYIPFAVIYVICAAAPEMSPDGSGYHLGLVGTYYRAHGLVKVPTHMYAHLSQGVEMLFLMAYAFGRHSAATLVHCAFLLVLPLLMVSFGNRTGHPAAGQIAALLVFCSPVVGVDGTSAYNDVAVACGLFAVVSLTDLWRQMPSPGLAVLLGGLAGFGYSMKYTAFLAVPYALYELLRRNRNWRSIALFILAAGVLILPWAGRNAIWYGNPFSPLLNQFFPNPYIHVSFEQDYGEYMRNYIGLASYWDLPLELTVRGKVLCGLLGPLFLLSPVALIAMRQPMGRRMLFATLWFGAPYALNVGTRFLIPALPYLCFAFVLAFGRWTMAAAVLAFMHALSAIPPIMERYSDPYAWRIARIPLRQALRLQPAEYWLNYRWPSFRIGRMIDQHTPKDAVVYTFTPFAEAYTTREVWTSFQSALGERLRDQVWSALIPDWQPQQERSFQFPAQGWKKVRVTQTAGNSRDLWSVHELRLFLKGQELPRASGWRLRAKPFIWDVQHAFDNHPGTRWRSWQRLEPGMFLEVEFPQAQAVDRIALEGSVDQHAVRLKAEGLDTDGHWILLGSEPETRGLVPALGLRRLAMEDLKAAGPHYLLVGADDYGQADFAKSSELWGIEKVAEVDGNRLYRIK